MGQRFQHPLDPQAMKLCRLLDHLGVPIAAATNRSEPACRWGKELERKAIAAGRVKSA